MTFAEMMALDARSADRFAAAAAPYPWGYLYGGHVVAQAVRAAAATVPAEEGIHSMHAYFLRAGEVGKTLDLSVDRVRDGRSFSVRSVVASQGGRALARVLASFHVEEASDDHSPLDAPRALKPEELASDGWSALFDRRYAPVSDPAQTLAWLRLDEDLGEDRVLQACALAYVADDVFDDPVIGMLGLRRSAPDAHAGPDGSVSTQSLDYSIWYHAPEAADGWLLHDFRCTLLSNACALVSGEVFAADGAHLATVAQQVLVRKVRQ